MAGDSFAGSRLSPMTGTSSATAGVGFSGIALPTVLPRGSLAGPGLPGGAFIGAALPPLMARRTGPLFGFATAGLANFADLLAFGISPSLKFTAQAARIQCSAHPRYDGTTHFFCFGSES